MMRCNIKTRNKLYSILLVVFFVNCKKETKKTVNHLIEKEKVIVDSLTGNEIKIKCLDTLVLDKRENKFFTQFLVSKQKHSSFTTVTETIEDSILLANKEKNNLIKAFTKIKSISSEKLEIVKPSSSCGLYFDNKSSVNLLDINAKHNFFRQDGFLGTQKKDNETSILQKYIDSSKVLFKSDPFYENEGSYFRLDKEKDQFFSKSYEVYSNDGGGFFTTYKVSNILDYDTNGWLKSAIIHRSFFKHYSTEEKRFINNQEDETLDVIWHYTYLETKLDESNSFIQSIIIYYVILDGTDLSEKVDFSFKKDSLTFIPSRSK